MGSPEPRVTKATEPQGHWVIGSLGYWVTRATLSLGHWVTGLSITRVYLSMAQVSMITQVLGSHGSLGNQVSG